MNATALMLLLAVRHYGYYLSPQRALLWNVLGSAVILVFIAQQLRTLPRWGLYVAAWWAAEECMVIGCDVAYMFRPWPIHVGQDMCSSLLEFDIGKVGAAVVAVLALRAAQNQT